MRSSPQKLHSALQLDLHSSRTTFQRNHCIITTFHACPHVILLEGRTKFNLMRSCGVVARCMNILRLSLDCRCLFCLGYLHSNAFMLVKNYALTLVKIYHEVPERRDDKYIAFYKLAFK